MKLMRWELFAAWTFLFFVCLPVMAQDTTASPTPIPTTSPSVVASPSPFMASPTPMITASPAVSPAPAATPSIVPAQPQSNADFLNLLLQSLGGLSGASALAVAGIVVQLLIKLLGTNWFGEWFPNLDGHIKLLVVTGLTLISGVLALMLPPTSLSLGAALMHSTTLAAFMVFGNQAYQQFLQAGSTPGSTKPA